MTSANINIDLRRVFIDTSAFFALISPKDTYHKDALAIRIKLVSAGSALFTTNFVLAETHALALTRINRKVALKVLTEIDSSSTTIARVSQSDEQKARAVLRKYDDKNFSLTDATSFAVMELYNIKKAFTFDPNFSQYGLQVLTADS